ncbi:MAG: hypothetical protein Q8L98_08170 [Chlamydiales bacterium]|nr:hypothetical protein [Chlamydiales bacterium]
MQRMPANSSSNLHSTPSTGASQAGSSSSQNARTHAAAMPGISHSNQHASVSSSSAPPRAGQQITHSSGSSTTGVSQTGASSSQHARTQATAIPVISQSNQHALASASLSSASSSYDTAFPGLPPAPPSGPSSKPATSKASNQQKCNLVPPSLFSFSAITFTAKQTLNQQGKFGGVNVYASISISATESLEYHLHFGSDMSHVPAEANADKLGLKAQRSQEIRHVSWSRLFPDPKIQEEYESLEKSEAQRIRAGRRPTNEDLEVQKRLNILKVSRTQWKDCLVVIATKMAKEWRDKKWDGERTRLSNEVCQDLDNQVNQRT